MLVRAIHSLDPAWLQIQQETMMSVTREGEYTSNIGSVRFPARNLSYDKSTFTQTAQMTAAIAALVESSKKPEVGSKGVCRGKIILI